MSTTMPRRAAEFWWNEISKLNIDIPRNVAYYEKEWSSDKWNIVAWEDIHRKRTERIQSNIKRKRAQEEIKPCLIWVFSHGGFLMGGYYTLIKTLKKEFYLDFRGYDISRGTSEEELKLKVMRLYPLCLPMPELFYEWMILFVKHFKNAGYYKGWKNQGLTKAYCKLDEYGRLLDIALNPSDLRV